MNAKARARARKLMTMMAASCLSVGDIQAILNHKLAKAEGFLFKSHKLAYFFHSYNGWDTERAIEIPVIRHYLGRTGCQDVLEIGNVTNHYYDYFRQAFRNKTVVDKSELGYDVMNLDICRYLPDSKFDFVFSISTFEHMDSDRGRNPSYVKGNSRLLSYAADGIKHVSDYLLKIGGKFVLTAPLGYASEWDETLYSGVLDVCNFREYTIYLFKKERELTWHQVNFSEGRKAVYGSPLPRVNYLSIVEFDK